MRRTGFAPSSLMQTYTRKRRNEFLLERGNFLANIFSIVHGDERGEGIEESFRREMQMRDGIPAIEAKPQFAIMFMAQKRYVRTLRLVGESLNNLFRCRCSSLLRKSFLQTAHHRPKL